MGIPSRTCPKCGEKRRGFKKLVDHMEACIPNSSVKCPTCDCSLDWREEWRHHEKQCAQRPENRKSEEEIDRLGRPASRVKINFYPLTADGKYAIVKRLNYAEGKCDGKCNYIIEPTGELFELCCANLACQSKVSLANGREEYLWCRRRTRKTLGLLTVAVPLDAQSFVIFDYTAKTCGIVSNTKVSHLTLLEGYILCGKGGNYATWRETALKGLSSLRTSISKDPVVKIESLQAVPRSSDSKTVLILASLSASFDNDAMGSMLENCALPQFPLHLAVGVCPKDTATVTLSIASKQMVGLTLRVDPKFFAILSPSDLEYNMKKKDISNMNTTKKKKGEAANRTIKVINDAVCSAKYAADDINQSLYERIG